MKVSKINNLMPFIFIDMEENMENNRLEFYTIEEIDRYMKECDERIRELIKEFDRCETEEDFENFQKRCDELNEATGNQIPYFDITLEEFVERYHLISHEDVWKKLL